MNMSVQDFLTRLFLFACGGFAWRDAARFSAAYADTGFTPRRITAMRNARIAARLTGAEGVCV